MKNLILPFIAITLLSLLPAPSTWAQDLPIVENTPAQPLLVKVGRLREALAYLGQPLPNDVLREIDAAERMSDDEAASRRVQAALDPLCVAGVMISPESRVKVMPGPAKRELVQQGWRQFLVKVQNGAGVTAPLKAASPQAIRLHNSPADRVRDRWLDLQMFDGRPLNARLSGAMVEYRIIQLYSRDEGKRSAVLSFNVGQGSQDIGFRNDVTLTFDCLPATPVTLRVFDENGEPTTAAFEIRDSAKRVYPSQAKRLAPDFFFHPQIYRADGEVITLPPGRTGVPTASSRLSRASTNEWREVVGRSPHPCFGLRALHAADRRCATRRHGAADPRRGRQDRRHTHLGPRLRRPKRILHRQRRQGLAIPLPAALRHRSVRLRLAPIRPPVPAATDRADLSGW
jgi:hypothetical protein